MKHLSIKWNIFLYLVGFSCLLLLILWLFQTVLLDSFYKRIKLRELGSEAEVIAGYFTNGDLDGVIRTVANRGDLYVEINSDIWGIIVITGNARNGSSGYYSGPSHYSEQEKRMYREEAERSGGFYTIQSQTDRRESILYAMLLPIGYENALLLVSADITPINATVETLRSQLVMISIIMLLLTLTIALLIAKRVSRPIESLGKSAGELESGNYDVSFQANGYREIEELSDALDNAAKELAKTEYLRRELIANVSHDLRTPLTLITGYAELVRDLPDENTQENMQVVIDESKRLTGLVSNMLDLSRLQSGVQAIQPSHFDLTACIGRIIERFAKFSEQEGLQIHFEHDDSCWVYADQERIEQVVYNFVSNAAAHTGEDRYVIVRQTIRQNCVVVEIIDTGEGIPNEHLNDIWERYYKLDKVRGTGLGLSIVRAILERHPDAEYGVMSEPGHGSDFWFSLPVEAIKGATVFPMDD